MGGGDDKIFYDSLHTADMPHARTRYKRSVFIITTFIEQNFKIYLVIPHLILLPAQFLSGKSQIVNISSLREIINSFCTYSFSVSANWWFSVCYKLQQHSHLKLFYTLKEGEIWEHWLCYLLHILFAYASCCGVYHTLSTTALKSPATTPDTGEGQAWGGAA